MIRPTSSANVAKGNMPHRQDHFPHGSAAIMRPTHFTGKMFPSTLRLFALHNLLRQTHFPYTNVQQNRFASRVVHFTHRPRFADSISPDKPGSRHAHMPIRRAASKSTPRALVMSITIATSSSTSTPKVHSTHPERRIQYIIHQLRTHCRTTFKSMPRALVRSVTPVPSSNANTLRIHSTHPEQRTQYIIHQLRTPCRTAFKSTPRALDRSITPVPSSNANTPQIHSNHPEQRIQRAIRLFLTHLLC